MNIDGPTVVGHDPCSQIIPIPGYLGKGFVPRICRSHEA